MPHPDRSGFIPLFFPLESFPFEHKVSWPFTPMEDHVKSTLTFFPHPHFRGTYFELGFPSPSLLQEFLVGYTSTNFQRRCRRPSHGTLALRFAPSQSQRRFFFPPFSRIHPFPKKPPTHPPPPKWKTTPSPPLFFACSLVGAFCYKSPSDPMSSFSFRVLELFVPPCDLPSLYPPEVVYVTLSHLYLFLRDFFPNLRFSSLL